MQMVRIAVRCHAQRQRETAIRGRGGGLVVMCGRCCCHAHTAGRLVRMAVEAVWLKVAVHGVHLCERSGCGLGFGSGRLFAAEFVGGVRRNSSG